MAAREAIVNYYEEKGVSHLAPSQILLTSGTSESFFHLFSLLGKPGDNILAPNPAYPLFDQLATMARIKLRHYPLREEQNWEIDLPSLEALADERTRALVLISPNNPTGAVASPEQISALVDWCNGKDIPLICDEVFSEFYFGPGTYPRPITLTKPKLCFTLNGISKMFALPAMKLGWIAVTGESGQVETYVDALETQTDTFLSCHYPIQQALPQIFKAGKNFLEDYRKTVQTRCEKALAQLRNVSGIQCHPPQGGFYMMLKICNPQPAEEEAWVIRLMEKQGVFVHPGYFFDYEDGVHLILSFLTKPEVLSPALEKIAELIRPKTGLV